MFTQNFTLRFFRSALIIAALLFLAASPALAYFSPGNEQAAILELGQPNFTGNNCTLGGKTGFCYPDGVALDPVTHKVFVADSYDHRVLRFASIYALTNGAPAEAVLGQPNFSTRTPQTTQNGMYFPNSVFVDAHGSLWVADLMNSRVLRFDNASSLANGANADGVLGQPDFTSNTPENPATVVTQSGMGYPQSVFLDASGRLWVADSVNNRVLRFDGAAAKANGAPADAVLGQPDFTHDPVATTQSGMNEPSAVFLDASGRLWVADQVNNRVLRFDNAARKPNGANADGVLGQLDFTSHNDIPPLTHIAQPSGLAVDNATGRLFVADNGHNRILVFDGAAGLPNGAHASSELGQPDFTTVTANTGGLSAASLSSPAGVFFDPTARVLLAADYANHRVLMYGLPTRYFSVYSTPADDGWVRESAQASHVGGAHSAAGTLRVGDDALNRQYRSILSFDTSGLPDNATIRSATLLILQAGSVGTDPFTSFGPLMADIRRGSFGTPALQNSDFQATASTSNFGHFTSVPNTLFPWLFPWYQVSLPPADFGDVNLFGLTQIRMRFKLASNINNVADYDTFYAGDATSLGNRPVLKIEFTVP